MEALIEILQELAGPLNRPALTDKIASLAGEPRQEPIAFIANEEKYPQE